MEWLFSKDAMYLWMLVLAAALFLPVRRLIFTLQLRRASREGELEEAEVERLRRRAGFTSALISFVFAFLYATYVFEGGP